MNRRDLLKLGASVAAQVSKPIAIAASPVWKPLLFDEHQNDTVISLTELIIPATDTPGAKAAFVNRHLDHLLHDGPVTDQESFLQGLAWLDGYTLRKHERPFVRCTPAQQTAILEALDTSEEPSLAAGHRFFGLAKRLTSRIYYATEIGFQELNKGGQVPATFACKD